MRAVHPSATAIGNSLVTGIGNSLVIPIGNSLVTASDEYTGVPLRDASAWS